MLYVSPDINNRELELSIITNSGSQNGISLFQEGFQVKSNSLYKLKFNGSVIQNRNLYAVLLDSKNNLISNEIKFELKSNTSDYMGEFQSIKDSLNAKIVFLVSKGGAKTGFKLDNVMLKKINRPVVINGLTKIEVENFYNKSETPQTQECSEGTLNVVWMTKKKIG